MISDEEFIDAAIEYHLTELNTCLPAIVNDVSYENNNYYLTVTPSIKLRLNSGNVVDMPKIYRVPVVFQRTQDTSVSFKPKVGDSVLLTFCQRSLDVWLENGGDVDPKDERMFHLTDAIAIPGLFSSDSNGKSIVSEDDFCINHKSNKITIKSNGDIEIGGGALNKVIKESFISAFNSHTHSGGVIQGNTGTPLVPIIAEQHITKTSIQ